jgi:transposase-like protein
MSRRSRGMRENTRTKEEGAVVERPAVEERDSESVVRGRPGRRTVEERQEAVLDLLAGKASVDQLARRHGVLPATVEGWRQDALVGVAEALRRGTGKTERERELEREVEKLRHVVTETAIERELWKAAAEKERPGRPTGPGRSWP